jgi:hypothetical protein
LATSNVGKRVLNVRRSKQAEQSLSWILSNNAILTQIERICIQIIIYRRVHVFAKKLDSHFVCKNMAALRYLSFLSIDNFRRETPKRRIPT